MKIIILLLIITLFLVGCDCGGNNKATVTYLGPSGLETWTLNSSRVFEHNGYVVIYPHEDCSSKIYLYGTIKIEYFKGE